MNNHFRAILFGLLFSTFMVLGGCEKDSTSSYSFLALGDSYTIGESVSEDQRWPLQLADSVKGQGFDVRDPKIIAQTGWTTTDLQEAINEENPDTNFDLVSLLIGVNNQYQGLDFNQFETEFEELLKRAISFADDSPESVFVVSIPDYGVTPFGQDKNTDQIAEELDRYNEAAQNISEEYNVTFINITPISKGAKDNPELTAEDGLHPSGKMYQEWVSEMLPHVLSKLQ